MSDLPSSPAIELIVDDERLIMEQRSDGVWHVRARALHAYADAMGDRTTVPPMHPAALRTGEPVDQSDGPCD